MHHPSNPITRPLLSCSTSVLVCLVGCGHQALEQENRRLTERIEALEARMETLESSKVLRGFEDALKEQQRQKEERRTSMLRPEPPNLEPQCREIVLTEEYERLKRAGRKERVAVRPECVLSPAQAAVRGASMAQAEAMYRGKTAQIVKILEWYVDADGRDDAWADQVEQEAADIIAWTMKTTDNQENPMHHDLHSRFGGRVPDYTLRCGRTACLFVGPGELLSAFTSGFKRVESLGGGAGFDHPSYPKTRIQPFLVDRVGFHAPPVHEIEAIVRDHLRP